MTQRHTTEWQGMGQKSGIAAAQRVPPAPALAAVAALAADEQVVALAALQGGVTVTAPTHDVPTGLALTPSLPA